MNLLPIPAFADNYIWLLHDGHEALVVDPGVAEPVMQVLQAHGLALRTILVTHHHADHVGGVEELRRATGAQVIGPAYETIPEPAARVQGGETLELLGLHWQVLPVPGHTSGHIAFYCADAGQQATPILFCGDTLFSAGCGRLFEGTAAQMLASLEQLATLPAGTRVCCAHEYTLANLRFAQTVEPNNPALIHHAAQCHALRAQGQPTLPTSIELEREINPFLRCSVVQVAQGASQFAPHLDTRNPLSVFTALREWKNVFQ
jgi:hydroxyacylglutathione hydrolase